MSVTKLLASAALLAMAGAADASAVTMQVSPNGSRPSMRGPAETFTGIVTVTPLYNATSENPAGAGYVEFTPGARSFWHSHPAGQTIVVVSGSGWVQQEGGEKIALKPGDVVVTPPGVKHWHGASADNSMSHITAQPAKDGKVVDWLEPVSDEQYR
jgi:quercetin dioxygenase-like cupin family protein